MAADDAVISKLLSELKDGYRAAGVGDSAAVLLAVSGGKDSVALADATQALFGGAGGSIALVHVDHGLRADESDRDARFVQQLAHQLKVGCYLETLNGDELRQSHSGSLEEAARKARYSAFVRTAQRVGCRYVVTAHHAQDQVETILHNLIRGTGLRGLAGMSLVRRLAGDVFLVRPMLRVDPQLVESYVARRSLSFCTDSTNNELCYTRNRLRHHLLPLLRQKYNGRVDQHLLTLGAQAASERKILDEAARAVLVAAMLENQAGVCRLRRDVLQSVSDTILTHLLVLLWDEQHWPRQAMSAEHWCELSDCIRTGRSPSMGIPGDLRVLVDESIVRIIDESMDR